MDDGGYKIVYNNEDYTIDDCGDYFMVYEKHKHTASFKTKDKAIEYATTMAYINNSRRQMVKDLGL